MIINRYNFKILRKLKKNEVKIHSKRELNVSTSQNNVFIYNTQKKLKCI